MEITNSNKELQSRREFFKTAAKAALPVIGVALLSHIPITATADACSWSSCTKSCVGGCDGTCSHGCKEACAMTCSTSCKNGCKNTSM